jgi:hypothetical protein
LETSKTCTFLRETSKEVKGATKKEEVTTLTTATTKEERTAADIGTKRKTTMPAG